MLKTLFISAGHGGIDPNDGKYTTMRDQRAKYFQFKNGKEYHENGFFYEGVCNRLIASEFTAQAIRAGFHVVPVFHHWQDTALSTRVKFANDTSKLFGYDSLYLSFHSNAANTRARGLYIFHHPKSGNGRRLSNDIAAFADGYWRRYGSMSNRAVREGYMYNGDGSVKGIYYENQAPAMPSIIIENGFFDNEQDADLLMQEDFREGLCTEILNGVIKYCKDVVI